MFGEPIVKGSLCTDTSVHRGETRKKGKSVIFTGVNERLCKCTASHF